MHAVGPNPPLTGATMTNLQLQLPDTINVNAGILIKALKDRKSCVSEQKGMLKQHIVDHLIQKLTFGAHAETLR
jgi:hypothetical protein